MAHEFGAGRDARPFFMGQASSVNPSIWLRFVKSLLNGNISPETCKQRDPGPSRRLLGPSVRLSFGKVWG